LITKQRCSQVELASRSLLHLEPMGAEEETAAASHFPFGGAGSRPPSRAGPVAELHVAAAATARSISKPLVHGSPHSGEAGDHVPSVRQ